MVGLMDNGCLIQVALLSAFKVSYRCSSRLAPGPCQLFCVIIHVWLDFFLRMSLMFSNGCYAPLVETCLDYLVLTS
eukprot:155319-Pelagomonas_calceolata.AAC.9